MSTTKKKSATPDLLPFCFNSEEETLAAESAVNKKFFSSADGSAENSAKKARAYATSRTLFVPEHPSLMMCCAILDFVKSLGGRPSSTT